jgi:hypothetical protein
MPHERQRKGEKRKQRKRRRKVREKEGSLRGHQNQVINTLQ